MSKRIKKQVAIALVGILTSVTLLSSTPVYADGNKGSISNEEIISEVSESGVDARNNLKKGKVIASSLNVRKGPSASNAKRGSLKRNAIVKIEKTSNGWHKIKYGNGYGYVSAEYILIINDSNNDGSNNSESNNSGSQEESVIKKGTVNTSRLNVRNSASTKGAKLGKVSKGTVVEIVKVESNGWYKIKYKRGYGYISAQYITDKNTSDGSGGGTTTPETVVKKGTVNTSTLNVRRSASTKGAKLGKVSKGTVVEIVKIENNGWYKIKYKKGYGYVSGEYITDKNTSDGSGGGTTTPETVVKKGTVNTSTLNVRRSASTKGAKLGRVSKGTLVEIVKIENNGWYKIKYKKGYGYVSGEYITVQNSGGGSGSVSSDRVFQNPAGYIQFKDKISVSGAGKNLVKGTMGLRVAKVQRKLGMGHVWEIVGRQTISKVKSFQKRKGLKATGIVDLATWKKMGFSESEWYSMDSYVTPVRINHNSTRQDIIEQMIKTAESYLGTEYIVGAAGVPGSGIDCSGLVMQSMYSIGIDPAPVSVTRHSQPGYEFESRNLWNLPTLKTVSKPKRGDLVFYKNSLGTIIHVAIYLGNNQVIESWPQKVVKWPLIHPQRPLIKGYKRVIG